MDGCVVYDVLYFVNLDKWVSVTLIEGTVGWTTFCLLLRPSGYMYRGRERTVALSCGSVFFN